MNTNKDIKRQLKSLRLISCRRWLRKTWWIQLIKLRDIRFNGAISTQEVSWKNTINPTLIKFTVTKMVSQEILLIKPSVKNKKLMIKSYISNSRTSQWACEKFKANSKAPTNNKRKITLFTKVKLKGILTKMISEKWRTKWKRPNSKSKLKKETKIPTKQQLSTIIRLHQL